MQKSAKDNPPMPETIANASAAASSLFLGHNGEWWDICLMAAAGLAGLVGVAIGISTAGSIVSHKREALAAEQSLEKYKLTVDGRVADAKKEGIEAGKNAGDALLKAAALTIEAEKLKSENLEVQKILLPRRLSGVIRTGGPLWEPAWLAGQQPALELFAAELRPFPRTEVWIQVFPDFEAQTLADDIKSVLGQIGWRPRLVSEQETRVPPLKILEGLRILTFRKPSDKPQDGAATGVEMQRPIVRASMALAEAMRKAGITTPFLNVQTTSVANFPQYTGSSVPYVDGDPTETLFLQVGPKPRTLELMLLQQKLHPPPKAGETKAK
jgi:hypothetical protein